MTGCDRGIWEATGAVVDKVLIPMGDNHSIEKGSIYRVKYFPDSDGTNTAYEIDSVPIPNTDIQLLPGDLNRSVSIRRISLPNVFQMFKIKIIHKLMFSMIFFRRFGAHLVFYREGKNIGQFGMKYSERLNFH